MFHQKIIIIVGNLEKKIKSRTTSLIYEIDQLTSTHIIILFYENC